MEPSTNWQIRIGALVMGLALAAAQLLPTCPCQWRSMFPCPGDVLIQMADATGHPSPSMVRNLSDTPRETCHCPGHQSAPLQVCSSEIAASSPAFTLGAAITFPPHGGVADRIRPSWSSGTDPPGREGLRLHLRWQVFLI